MTERELIHAVRSGECIMVGEYRMSKAEEINWRDKTNGRPLSAVVLRHTVEFGDKSVVVNERVPSEVKLADVKWIWQKGQTVALKVSEYTSAKGVVSCRGQLVPFSSDLHTSTGESPTPVGVSKASR